MLDVVDMHYLNLLSIASDLAQHPVTSDEEQDRVCRQYGLTLDSLTDDDVKLIEQMIVKQRYYIGN